MSELFENDCLDHNAHNSAQDLAVSFLILGIEIV